MKPEIDTIPFTVASFDASRSKPDWKVFEAATEWLKAHPENKIETISWGEDDSRVWLNIYFFTCRH